MIFFLFPHKNICCGYSLEASQRGASNEHPKQMFSWRNKKTVSTFRLKKSDLSGAMFCYQLSLVTGKQIPTGNKPYLED